MPADEEFSEPGRLSRTAGTRQPAARRSQPVPRARRRARGVRLTTVHPSVVTERRSGVQDRRNHQVWTGLRPPNPTPRGKSCRSYTRRAYTLQCGRAWQVRNEAQSITSLTVPAACCRTSCRAEERQFTIATGRVCSWSCPLCALTCLPSGGLN